MKKLTSAILIMAALTAGYLAPRPAWSQNDIDEGGEDDKLAVVLSEKERKQRVAASLRKMAIRVRVTKMVPERELLNIRWRVGGEGLGGDVTHGQLLAADKQPTIKVNEWSSWLPLDEMVREGRRWEFPTLTVGAIRTEKEKPTWASEAAVEFEFSVNGKVVETFTETATKGATVSFAFPVSMLVMHQPGDAEFTQKLSGLAEYVKKRYERLAAQFAKDEAPPEKLAFFDRLGGYDPTRQQGYGIRHSNPEIVRDEIRTMRMLGINSLTGGLDLARGLGLGKEMSRMAWGGPGATTPMDYYRKNKDVPHSPFAPAIRASIEERTTQEIEELRAQEVQEAWAMWGDEIGTAYGPGLETDPGVQAAFREYLRSQDITPQQVGAASWNEVLPHSLYTRDAKGKYGWVPTPVEASESLRFYYTFRLMTYATAQLYAPAAKRFKAAGFPMFAMQTPSPSWSGANLDWHEFYDNDANGAIVFETSNRDARVWQLESYLADIARGIAERKDLEMGVLVKPHRGAPQQRALSLIARGARAVRWYTYGPDYAKGDSFSQEPELLDEVAKASRFLGRAEPYVYEAKWAKSAEVAFVSPRSTEIWNKTYDHDNNRRTVAGREAAFEDAKWVYLALAHAHIPVDVVSEQRLAEGKLNGYKAIYIVGPN